MNTRLTIAFVALFAAGLTLLPAAQAGAPARKSTSASQSPDYAFLVARDAFREGNLTKLNSAATAMGGHVLEPYVGYWQLRLRLEERRPDEILWYLERHAGTLLAENLRRDWLKVLGKKGEWTLFQQQLPLLVDDDAEVSCYSLAARWHSRDTVALTQLKTLWDRPRELPEACMPLAQSLLEAPEAGVRVPAPGETPDAAAQRWTAAQIWERFRILTDAGISGRDLPGAARRLLTTLPRAEVPDARQLDAAWGSSIKYLERPAPDLSRRPQRELYMLAVARVARNDAPLAASYWEPQVRERFAPEDRAWLLGVIATHAARKHQPEAVRWFAEIAAMGGAAQLSDEQLAWRARIALRQGQWGEVRAAIEHMSLAAANDPTWIYWLGRAFAAQSNAAAAGAQYARIAGQHHFYGRLASEELGHATTLPAAAAPATPEELAAAAAHPGLQRALALYRLEMRTEALREWLWAVRPMDDRALLASAELARRHEIWDRAINTADRTLNQHDFRLRYMAPYREVLAGAAREREVDEALVLGVVRQESRFMFFAKSSVGASGLMQLMPATAAWVARKMGMRDYAWSKVHQPEVNAKLGTFYLRQVLDELDGLPVVAAAAYNAGPGRARRWRDSRPLEGAIYAETIPFNETRDYAKKVMANSIYYAALQGESRSLKARLGIVGPKPANGAMVARQDDPTP
jgi:soluble lytic murein transglycosylase